MAWHNIEIYTASRGFPATVRLLFEMSLQKNVKSHVVAFSNKEVTRDIAVIPRWPSAAILDTIEPQIAPFDLPTPKTLVERTNMEWIGCTVCEIFAFKLYCDLEIGVRGHSISSKAALFDRAHTTFYSSSIVTICLYLVPFPRYSRILVKNCCPLVHVFGAPVGGEAVRFTRRPALGDEKLEWRAYQTMKECDVDDAFSRFDTIHACDWRTDGQTDGIDVAYNTRCCRA